MSHADIVYHRLDRHQIAYEVYTHPAVFTVQESHALDLQIPAAHTKNLFLISKKDPSRCFLICLSADKKLRINEFARQHGLKDLTFGSPELMQAVLGVSPGSVTLFGIIHYRQQIQEDQKKQKSDTFPRLEVFIDRELREADAVGWHPMINTATVVIGHQGLEQMVQMLDIGVTLFDPQESS